MASEQHTLEKRTVNLSNCLKNRVEDGYLDTPLDDKNRQPEEEGTVPTQARHHHTNASNERTIQD